MNGSNVLIEIVKGPDPPPPPPKKNASYATQHQPEDAAQYRTSYSDHTDTQKQSMRSVEYNALTPRASVHNMSVGQDTRSQSIGGASASQYEYSEDNVQNLSREVRICPLNYHSPC